MNPRCALNRCVVNRCVVKLGGSLLSWPNWPDSLTQWLHQRADRSHIIVVGGGRWVDGLRQLDTAVGLGDFVAHATAIEWMYVTALMASRQLGLPIVDALSDEHLPGNRIANVPEMLNELPTEVPCSWDITSDSLAAIIAHHAAADLVLLKSRSPHASTPPNDAAALAREQIVDRAFPSYIAAVQNWSIVNLRTDAATCSTN